MSNPPECESIPTGYFEVSVEVSVREQGLGQLSQVRLEQRGHVVGVEAPRLQVHVGAAVEQLPEGLLPHAVPRHPEQTLHVQI